MKLRDLKKQELVDTFSAAADVDPNGDFERAYTEVAGGTVESIIAQRHEKHGDWRERSNLSQSLKTVMGLDMNSKLRPDEREALEMIAVKISRILSGDPHLEDHWRDIAGYATLAADQNKLSA